MSITRNLLFAICVAYAAASETPSQQLPLEWTLVPAQDHSVDALSFEHLKPSHSVDLYFTTKENPNAFATAEIQQIESTVVLEHSAYIQHVSCQKNTIELTFDSPAALKLAHAWPSSGLVLVTNHVSCNPIDERGLYLVTGSWTQIDALQLRAGVSKTSWEEVADTMEVKYGVARHDSDRKPHHKSNSAGLHKRTPSTCSVVPISLPGRDAICGGKGIILRPQILQRFPAREKHITCARTCISDQNCASFSYNRWTGYCLTFKKSIKSQKYVSLKDGLVFYDKQCWQTRGDCSSCVDTSFYPIILLTVHPVHQPLGALLEVQQV